MQSLSTRGISISQLAGQADPKTSISSPSKARELRELRIELGLSQEEAGAIVQKYLDTPITKAGWSKMETSGNGPHFAEAMAALSAERHVRNKAAKAALPSGTAPTPDEIYAFNRAGILQTEPVTAEGASK